MCCLDLHDIIPRLRLLGAKPLGNLTIASAPKSAEKRSNGIASGSLLISRAVANMPDGMFCLAAATAAAAAAAAGILSISKAAQGPASIQSANAVEHGFR
jgi:hypothetical protein